MNRRGFLGSLAALVGAKVVKDALPDELLPSLPVHTNGYVRTIPFSGESGVTITSNATASSTYLITASLDPAGEGIRWNYTTGQVQS